MLRTGARACEVLEGLPLGTAGRGTALRRGAGGFAWEAARPDHQKGGFQTARDEGAGKSASTEHPNGYTHTRQKYFGQNGSESGAKNIKK